MQPDVSNGLVSGCRICCLIPGIAPHWFPAHEPVSSALQPTSTVAALMKYISKGEDLKSRLILQSHINTQIPAASSAFWRCFLSTKEKWFSGSLFSTLSLPSAFGNWREGRDALGILTVSYSAAERMSHGDFLHRFLAKFQRRSLQTISFYYITTNCAGFGFETH